MADLDNYDYDSDSTPTSIAEFKAKMLRKKKRMEKKGLLPTYDYPEPKGTETGGTQHSRPITVLNDNPGPDLRHQDLNGHNAPSLSGRLIDSCYWRDENGSDTKSHLQGIEGWKNDTHLRTSVYQSTHNAQALTKKKLKPEKRGALRNEPANLKYSLTGRGRVPRIQDNSPGPCHYPEPIRDSVHHSFTGKNYPPVINDGDRYVIS